MKKKIAIMLIFILIMVLPFQILAQDDEETDYIWLKQEIEIAQNIKEPVIYSKSAVYMIEEAKPYYMVKTNMKGCLWLQLQRL